MSEQPHLEPLPLDDVRRILCVVAHPDDMEYGLSAAVVEWVGQGIEVAYLLLTSGEAGMQVPPEEVGPLRAAEQRAACEVVGVSDLTILDHPDGVLEWGLPLRRDIARRIRELRPEAVVTTTWEVAVEWGLNQADHRAAGLATLDACRDADNTWVFPELAREEALAKWGPTWLLVGGDARPTHYQAVSPESVAAAVRSLECHAEYLASIPGHPAPSEIIPAALAEGGRAAGVEHAVAVHAYRLRTD